MRTATAHVRVTQRLLDARREYQDVIRWALEAGLTEEDIRRILMRPIDDRLAEESTPIVLEGPIVSQKEGPQPKPKPVRRARKRAELTVAEADDTHQIEPVEP
jgi:hypothetical protein